MAIYVRPLTDEERIQLEDWASDPNVRPAIQQRAMAVLLSSEGQRVPAAAEQVGLHPLNLRKWIHRFNEDGPEGLLDRPRSGRPPKFEPDLRSLVREIVAADPHTLGLPYDDWSATRLMRYLRQARLVDDCSYEWVRQLYNEAKVAARRKSPARPTQPRAVQSRPVPERRLRPVFQAAGTT